ncbi:MAG: metalloregulator ArsR/SmtB family transcription factor [Pseudomonadota bacterium]
MTETSLDRILQFIKSRGPLSAPELADLLSISTPGAQQRLALGLEQGLLDFEDRASGRGRPRRYFHLTEKGHSRFPDRHSELTLEMLGSIEDLFGSDGIDRLISHREQATLDKYQTALAEKKDLRAKLEELARLRAQEGYMAEVQEQDDGSWLLVENHCPICAAATRCQGFCRSELSIFQTVLDGLATIERTDHILEGARRCAYRVRPVNGE